MSRILERFSQKCGVHFEVSSTEPPWLLCSSMVSIRPSLCGFFLTRERIQNLITQRTQIEKPRSRRNTWGTSRRHVIEWKMTKPNHTYWIGISWFESLPVKNRRKNLFVALPDASVVCLPEYKYNFIVANTILCSPSPFLPGQVFC